MNTLRSILRLHLAGKGSKTISNIIYASRTTIRKYIARYYELELCAEDLTTKSDSELAELFGLSESMRTKSERQLALEVELPKICKRLALEKDISRTTLHKEYIEQHPDGYSRARFNRMIQAYMATPKAVMPQEHKAGDKLFVDYAGKKLHTVDCKGEMIPVEVFVAILGCSQYIYVEVSPSQQKRHFIASCQNALHYYGGVPDAIVTDNLKSAVSKVSRYEPGINEDFGAFADHYGVAVSPTRAYRPKDKALVENAVRLVYAKIYQPIKEMSFSSIEELNKAIVPLLYQMNCALFSGKDHSRQELFEQVESKVLGKLNPIPFEIKRRMMVTVMRNYHIRLSEDSHYYSVPFEYIGKKVRLIYDDNNVEIFYRYELIARHGRNTARYGYTTNKEHQPADHRFLAERSPSYFISKAQQIDPLVAKYIARVLESKSYYEQGYKACSGILSFARKLSNDRLINACRFADSLGKYNYTIIEEILTKDLDLIPKEGVCNDIPTHNNIRGNEYYY